MIDADGRARRTVDIEVTGSPMMHDFSLTERHVVFYDLPVTFDPVPDGRPMTVPRWLRLPARLMLPSLIGRVRIPDPIAAQVNRNSEAADTGSRIAWNPKYPARIGVMPRDGDNADVRWFDVEPCYVFHPLNAYSIPDGDEVLVLDVVRNAQMFDREHRGPSEGRPTLDRWTIDLANGTVHTERRDDRTQEFPRINETLTGRRHRYGYTVGVEGGLIWDDKPGNLRTALYKHDYATADCVTAPLDPDLVTGEMSFVPNPDPERRGRRGSDGLRVPPRAR